MVTWKQWVATELKGKHIIIETDCILNSKSSGRVVDVEWSGVEPILCLMTDDNKIIKIGCHTPGFRLKFK